MRVSGAVPFSDAREMNKIIDDLKREFGVKTKIYVKRWYVAYECNVSRDSLMV